MNEDGIQSQVLYWSTDASRRVPGFGRVVKWDVDLIGGYPWTCPPAHPRPSRRMLWCLLYLRRLRPDVIVAFGWASPVSRMAIVYALLTRTRLLFFGDSSIRGEESAGGIDLRGLALRALFRVAYGAISTGSANAAFYQHYGVPVERIFPGVLPADIGAFAAARATRHAATSVTESRSLDSIRIVYAGKMTEAKAPLDLVAALAELAEEDCWAATFVGDGGLLPSIRSEVDDAGLSGRVEFFGFANTTDMPDLMAAADVFVLPSRQEPYGLVALEAAAAGAAVVVSDSAGVWGGSEALVEHGVSGLVFQAGDHSGLATQIHRLLHDRALLESIRTEGTRRSAWFGPLPFARSTVQAAHRALRERGSH